MTTPTHVGHALLLGLPSVGLFWAAVAERLRPAAARPRSAAVVVTSLGLLGAAGVHAWVAPEHFAEYALFGWFFVGLACAQVGGAAALLVRPTRWLLLAALAGSLLVVLLWAQTRLVAVPLGPEAGAPEAVGPADLLATACEVVAALSAARALGLRARLGATATVMLRPLRAARPPGASSAGR